MRPARRPWFPPCPIWHFWNPNSGAVGGAIIGTIVTTILIYTGVFHA